MRKLINVWLVCVWILGAVGSVVAQSNADANSVMVYDHEVGSIWEIDSGGREIDQFVLPIPALFPVDSYEHSRQIAVTPDGNRFAYLVSGDDATGVPRRVLVFYDHVEQTVLSTLDLTGQITVDMFDLTQRPVGFTAGGTSFAHSYARSDTDQLQIDIIDVASGSVLFSLTGDQLAQNAAFAAFQESTPTVMGWVQRYSGSTVDLTVFPLNTEIPGNLLSYRWNIVTNQITQTRLFPTLQTSAVSTTGDIVFAATDERLPYTENVAFGHTNTLQVYDPRSDARYPFFANDALDFFNPVIIQGGDRVLVRVTDILTQGGATSWQFVMPNGSISNVPSFNAMNNQVMGVPDGFFYLQAESMQLMFADTRTTGAMTSTAVWQPPSIPSLSLVWGSTADADASETIDWAQLADPIVAQQIALESQSAPTDAPDTDTGSDTVSASDLATQRAQSSSGGALTVNDVAIINTTEGDRLNMRRSPGLGTSVIARVENGTRVVLLAGPRAVDGFVWWEVRLPTGLTGWVVESADGVRTLIPTG